MSFGSKKQEVPKVDTSFNFNSPYGAYTNSGNNATWTPTLNDMQQGMKGLTDTKLVQTLQGLPTSFDVDSYYNNPFYESTLRQIRQPMDFQFQDEERQLNNQLSARNQLGGSYDALMRKNFSERKDRAYRGAEDSARDASAQAYQQQQNNLLATLAGLRSDRNQALDAELAPLRIATGVQGNILQANAQNAQLAQNAQIARQQQQGNLLGALLGVVPALTGFGMPVSAASSGLDAVSGLARGRGLF